MAVFVLLLSGCVTSTPVNVSSDFDRNVNFSQYRTYNWYFDGSLTDPETGGQRPAGYDSFLDKRIKNALQSSMGTKGMQLVTSNPDIKVAYDVKIENRAEVDRVYATYPGYGYGYGYWMGYRYNYGYNRFGPNYATIREYKEGTIIIDFIDPKDNQLVWRGWGEAIVNQDGSISEATVNKIVAEIMERYPPKP